jgi:hypothetical protein
VQVHLVGWGPACASREELRRVGESASIGASRVGANPGRDAPTRGPAKAIERGLDEPKLLRSRFVNIPLADAEQALERFSARWDEKYPAISPSWRADWERLSVFFDFPPEIRRVIYTTNAIESLNYSMRKVLKNRGAFPNDESILKLLYLGLNRVAKRWTMQIWNRKAALNQFVIMYGDGVPG